MHCLDPEGLRKRTVLKLHSDWVRHLYASPIIIIIIIIIIRLKLQLGELGGKFVMHDSLTQNFSRKTPEGKRVLEKSKCK